jgi:hypothetical protein
MGSKEKKLTLTHYDGTQLKEIAERAEEAHKVAKEVLAQTITDLTTLMGCAKGDAGILEEVLAKGTVAIDTAKALGTAFAKHAAAVTQMRLLVVDNATIEPEPKYAPEPVCTCGHDRYKHPKVYVPASKERPGGIMEHGPCDKRGCECNKFVTTVAPVEAI